jgi:hypothetical protein
MAIKNDSRIFDVGVCVQNDDMLFHFFVSREGIRQKSKI